MKHTPGPWVFGGTNSWEVWAKHPDHAGYAICYLKPKLDSRPIQDPAEREANAHLIAAAPTMFAACRLAHTAIDKALAWATLDLHQIGLLTEAINALEVALAKARGGNEG